MGREFIAIVDETGSNRPLDKPTVTFGVGGILFARELESRVVDVGKRLQGITQNSDFKYKDVRRDTRAREAFLGLLNHDRRKIRCYGFFTAATGVAKGDVRDAVAGERYATFWPKRPDETEANDAGVSETLLRSFVKYMAPNIAAHAVTNDYNVEVYWDRRNDIDVIRRAWDEIIADMAKVPQYSAVRKVVKFAGQVSGPLSAVARLSGVVAGDVQQYFLKFGGRIWPRLDPAGREAAFDPILRSLIEHEGPATLFSSDEYLADADAITGSGDTVMLQGYYKAFLENDVTRHPLISFASPDGQYGLLRIERGDRWHVHQLPD